MIPSPRSNYGVTLERGTDGSYLAWVDDVPGCAVRGRSREEVLNRLPAAIESFLEWTGVTAPSRGVAQAIAVRVALAARDLGK